MPVQRVEVLTGELVRHDDRRPVVAEFLVVARRMHHAGKHRVDRRAGGQPEIEPEMDRARLLGADAEEIAHAVHRPILAITTDGISGLRAAQPGDDPGAERCRIGRIGAFERRGIDAEIQQQATARVQRERKRARRRQLRENLGQCILRHGFLYKRGSKPVNCVRISS